MGLKRSKNLTSAKKTCDLWFSKYIRIRDADPFGGRCKCITCDTVKDWKEMDAGHFMSRRFMSTRYDEMNCHAQCQKCNQYGAGEQYKHGKMIDALHGEGHADYLEKESKKLKKYNKQELMDLANEFKTLAELQAKFKGIKI
jgi:hypothetical protein